MSVRRSTSWMLAFVIAAMSAGIGGGAQAQRGANPRAEARRERQAARAEAKSEGKEGRGGARQQALAGQVRQAFQRVVKQRLSLNDDQARRLREVDDRYETQRDAVALQEREARQNLRAALAAPKGSSDQSKVDENMAALTNAQKRRAEIFESEQKDLGAFLTPVQRAQYFSLRDNFARRVQQMRQNAAAGKTPPDSL